MIRKPSSPAHSLRAVRLPLEEAAEGYKLMDERLAIKVLLEL